MEMCYDGTLVMPQNFSVVTADEMEYVDGGLYISNATLWDCCRIAFCTAGLNPIGATLVALGAYKAYTILAAGVSTIAKALGIAAGPIGWVLGLLGVGAVLGFGTTIVKALMQDKGIEITPLFKLFGIIPLGVDVSIK